MASINDVARLAGVSPTTVSHTISGKRKVSEHLSARVLDAMRELDFVPRRAAQNLALGRTGVIALVVPDIAIEYFAELAKGIENAAIQRGYNLMLATTGFSAQRENRYIEMIASQAVDGIILASGATLHSRTREALTRGLPIVLIDEEITGLRLPTFVSDNEAGGRLAAEHLLRLGHGSALEIQGTYTQQTTLTRHRGFRSVLAGQGGALLVATGDYTIESGRAATLAHIDAFLDRSITAVFAHNDLMAFGAVDALRSCGLRVPEDVSVIGFDDVSIAQIGWPALTSVRQNMHELGVLAVSSLLDALSGEHRIPAERTVLPVELIVRHSTAARG